MKKALKITGIVVLVIILLMIFIPFLFTDQIAGIVKKEANKRLNATLNFEDVGLNMFSSFPDITLSIDRMTVVNKAPFAGDTLASMKSFKAAVGLWSLIGGSQIKVKEIKLVEPSIKVIVLKDSTANYNIVKDTAQAAEDTAAGGLNLALKEYSIENASIAYVDQTSGISALIKGLNHSGTGDFTGRKFNIDTETKVGEITLTSGGVTYLNKAQAGLDLTLFADMDNKKFTLKENEFRLNNLALKFDGYFDMHQEDNIAVDLTFASRRADFKDIISLIPAIYKKDFGSLKSSGKMTLNGNAKGVYSTDRLPGFSVKLLVENGFFQYPKLPSSVKNFNMELYVNNPGGTADNTIIDMKKLHLELGGDPLDARLLVKTPKSNPYIDTKVKGRLNLSQVKNVVTLEDVTKLSGVIDADFDARGTMASIKNGQAENITANGRIAAQNIIYGSKTMPEDVKINQALLTMNTRTFTLNNFSMNLGQSDLSANGSLSNVIGYVMSDGTIRGNLNVSSRYLNLNPLMQKDEGKAVQKNEQQKPEAVEVPERINFVMNSSFNRLIYDNLTIDNVRGTITIADRRVMLNSLTMNMLNGSLTASGYYFTPEGAKPSISFDLGINGFDIAKTFQSFVTVKQFAPAAGYMNGTFGAKLTMATPLNNDMTPDWGSFNSTGNLNLARAEIKGFKPLEMLGNTLKLNELKNPVLTNVNPSFTIRNGRFAFSPFTYSIAGNNVTISGSNGIDRSIDYAASVEIPAGNLKNQANSAISKLIKRDVELITANSINVKALIKGRIDDPVVTTTAADVAGETVRTAKEEVRQQVQQEVDKRKEQVQQEIEKRKDEAQQKVEQKADTLKEDLKKKAEEEINNIFKRKK